MKNIFSYPFERNRFFYGKLLTVADFESEQRYFNDKRRFLNKYLFGSGVICGLNSYSIDDNSIMIEAGSAIDSMGREIVVHESVIRKLSGIEGFDKTQSDTIYLSIGYSESPTEPVYSIAGSTDQPNGSSEFNRVQEGYHLFITDESQVQQPQAPLDSMVKIETLYSDKNITIKQSVPVILPFMHSIAIIVEVTRHTADVPVTFDYVIDTPYFTTPDGSNKINVRYDDSMAGGSERYILSYELTPPNYKPTTAAVTVQGESVNLVIAGKKQVIDTNLTYNITVSDMDILGAIENQYFSTAMDAQTSGGLEKPIYLAKIKILRSNTSYLIESVKPVPFGQYCFNPQLSLLGTQLENYLPLKSRPTEASDTAPKIPVPPPTAVSVTDSLSEVFSTGVVEIPLGLNPRAKQKFYSEEIMHGLGKGNVNIRLGIESTQNALDSTRGSYTVFGNPDVFEGSEYEPAVPKNSLGAMTYNERGTFVIGLKLYETTNLLSVKVRWFAFKDVSSSGAAMSGRSDKCIFIKPDTVVLAPREKAYLKAIFYNMDESPCKWWVADENGGTVEANGEYTAPSKTGVYEVCVENLANPSLKASAFVVVKEKGAS